MYSDHSNQLILVVDDIDNPPDDSNELNKLLQQLLMEFAATIINTNTIAYFLFNK
ncbi:MAG: hypothetical protein ABI840_12080 [bacterium]